MRDKKQVRERESVRESEGQREGKSESESRRRKVKMLMKEGTNVTEWCVIAHRVHGTNKQTNEHTHTRTRNKLSV